MSAAVIAIAVTICAPIAGTLFVQVRARREGKTVAAERALALREIAEATVPLIPVYTAPTPTATQPLLCKVVRIHGDHVESLHPGAELISRRDARVLFENAKLGPHRGVVQVIEHGKVRASVG